MVYEYPRGVQLAGASLERLPARRLSLRYLVASPETAALAPESFPVAQRGPNPAGSPILHNTEPSLLD